MSLQDVKRTKLIDLGYSGSLRNMERAFYIDEGATGGGSINDLEYSFLAAKGFSTGSLNDRWKAYLISLGYSGALNNMLVIFWTDYTSGPPELGYVFDGYVDVGYYTPE